MDDFKVIKSTFFTFLIFVGTCLVVGAVGATSFNDTIQADTWQSLDGATGDPATIADKCMRLYPEASENESDFNYMRICYPRTAAGNSDTDFVHFTLRGPDGSSLADFLQVLPENEDRNNSRIQLGRQGRLSLGKRVKLAPPANSDKPHFAVQVNPELFSGTHMLLDLPNSKDPDVRFFVKGDTELQHPKQIQLNAEGDIINRMAPGEHFRVHNTSDTTLFHINDQGQLRSFIWDNGSKQNVIKTVKDVFGTDIEFIEIGENPSTTAVSVRGDILNDTSEYTYTHNLESSGFDAHQTDAHRARPTNLCDTFPKLTAQDTGVEVVHDGSNDFPPGRYEYLPNCDPSSATNSECVVHLRSGTILTPAD